MVQLDFNKRKYKAWLVTNSAPSSAIDGNMREKSRILVFEVG